MRPIGRLWILCTFVFAAGFIAAGYLNYVQHQKAQADQAQLAGTISELKSQMARSRLSTPVPSASPDSGTAVLSSSAPTPLVITELGVKLRPTAPLVDLTYRYQQISGVAIAGLTTSALIKSTTTCGPGALGNLVRRPITYKPTSLSKFIATVGGYNYYYVAPTNPCATDPVTAATLATDKAALPTILATLTGS